MLPHHAMRGVSQNGIYLQEARNINISQTFPTLLALLVSNRKVANTPVSTSQPENCKLH